MDAPTRLILEALQLLMGDRIRFNKAEMVSYRKRLTQDWEHAMKLALAVDSTAAIQGLPTIEELEAAISKALQPTVGLVRLYETQAEKIDAALYVGPSDAEAPLQP